jgi:S-adenosylmethionine decarboxylase
LSVNKPFGYSYLLDMFDCLPGTADDMELTYRLQMTQMSAPVVIHAPRDKGVEIYPEKAGVSGWVPLIESGIQIHSIEPTHFITLDVYSCREFDTKVVYDFAQETFGFKSHEHFYTIRGRNYGK